MQTYEVSQTYYFREIGQKVAAGSTIELRQGDAQRYLQSHPGLLKPVRRTTQQHVTAVRTDDIAPSPTAEEVPPAPADTPSETVPEATGEAPNA